MKNMDDFATRRSIACSAETTNAFSALCVDASLELWIQLFPHRSRPNELTTTVPGVTARQYFRPTLFEKAATCTGIAFSRDVV